MNFSARSHFFSGSARVYVHMHHHILSYDSLTTGQIACLIKLDGEDEDEFHTELRHDSSV